MLDNAGKLLKPLGSPLLIIPAPDLFWNHRTPVGEDSDLKPAQYHEVYNRALIDRLGVAMLPAISLIASDRGLITILNEDQFLLHHDKVQLLTSKNVALVMSPVMKGVTGLKPCKMPGFIRAFSAPASRFVFLNQSVPPPGISSFREVVIWSEGNELNGQSYSWMNEWPMEVPLALADDFSIRSAGSNFGQLLTMKP